MSKIYERALETYTAKTDKKKQANTETNTLLKKASDAIKAADNAIKTALSKQDRNAYKKAVKQKAEAEGDEQYYRDLLSQPAEIGADEKLEAKKIISLVQMERDDIMRESEALIYEKLKELYRLTLEKQLELKKLWWCENAYRIEVLKENRNYTSWDISMQPQCFHNIFKMAQSCAFMNNDFQKDFNTINKKIDADRSAEREKWGPIGGNDT